MSLCFNTDIVFDSNYLPESITNNNRAPVPISKPPPPKHPKTVHDLRRKDTPHQDDLLKSRDKQPLINVRYHSRPAVRYFTDLPRIAIFDTEIKLERDLLT